MKQLSAALRRVGPILLLTPNGQANSVGSTLETAGFQIVVGRLAPGEVSSLLTNNADVDQIWIWNDGSQPLRDSTTAPNPLLAFNQEDLDALSSFQDDHGHWIMDGLAWRSHETESETNLTANEAFNLAAAGGGIVLGADNGPPNGTSNLITQHVNQVAEFFDFELFLGAYETTPDEQFQGGTLFDNPRTVDPSQLLSSTSSYAELPNGEQPNGVFLETTVFGSPSAPLAGFEATSLPLETDAFGGQEFSQVNHVVTTSIPGGGNQSPSARWLDHLS